MVKEMTFLFFVIVENVMVMLMVVMNMI